MKPIYGLIIIFVISISLFSCKKKEEKIIGTWEFVRLSNYLSDRVITWQFTSEKNLIKTVQFSDSVKIVDTAEYSLDTRFLNSPNLLITKLTNDSDGTYEILTLNKDILIIQRVLDSEGNSQGAFLRAEFEKK